MVCKILILKTAYFKKRDTLKVVGDRIGYQYSENAVLMENWEQRIHRGVYTS